MVAVSTDDALASTTQQTDTLLNRLLFPLKNGFPQVPWLASGIAVSLAAIVFGVYRWYQQNYSFTVGLDYFEPAFQTYWMNLFWVQMILITTIGAIGVPWLWLTRPDEAEMTPQKELGTYYLIFSLMAMGSFLIVVILGLFAEADAAWHQVTIRDTDFTPTHIGLFYFAIPVLTVFVVLAFVWVHTRMPDFRKRVSLSFAVVASAPILIMPNLGLNEWGHTFFYAEELFAAPIHYGFVFLGWGIFAISGFLLQCFNRIRVLTLTLAEQENIQTLEPQSNAA